MKKLIAALVILMLTSFNNKPKEYYALVGELNDFSVLKTALMKDSVGNKNLLKWIDASVVSIKTK